MKNLITISLTLACINPSSGESLLTGNSMIKHSVEINNHKFAVYEKEHDSPKDIIVFIHGRTISALPNFDLQVKSKNVSVMDAFIKNGFQVYAMDMRGFGNTPRDASGWINPEKASKDVTGLLEWVIKRHPNSEKPTLFGYSYGSLVSHFVVQEKPELVSQLVLYGHPIDHTYASRYVQNDVKEINTEAELIRKPNSVEWASSDFIINSAEKEVIDAYILSALKLDPTLADWHKLSQWTQLKPGRITVPTLLINGVHDPVSPVDKLAVFFGGISNPDRSWVIIPESGHAAHLENSSGQMVSSIVNFIRRKE